MKTGLLDARRDVPERLRAVRQVLPQVESLAAGVADVATWVREGDALLDGEKAQLRAGLTAGADEAPSLAAIELLLERHRVRSPYRDADTQSLYLNPNLSLTNYYFLNCSRERSRRVDLFWRTA